MIKYLKKLFTETKISWKNLLVFSILIGLTVGILNRIPFLADTSFTDIAVVLEMWIIFAIFIISNSKSWQEAVLKTFVFFLISQPLIYLSEAAIEAIFDNINFFERVAFYFNQYYFHGGNWFIWTLLTIPGAFIAYQIKSDSVLSGVVLSVATCYLAFAGANSLLGAFIIKFPNHLLNGLLCLFFAAILIPVILKNKTARIIAIVITTIGLFGGIFSFIETKRTNDYWQEQTRLELERLDAESMVK